MSKQKPSDHYDKRLHTALEALESSIAKADHSTGFVEAYQLLDARIVDGRTFTDIVFDDLMDAYVAATYGLPLERVPLAPYILLLKKSGRTMTDEDARFALQADREDYSGEPILEYAPEFVTLFGKTPRIEVMDVMPRWKEAAVCLANVLQSTESLSVINRMNRHLERTVDLFNINYEPCIDGTIKLKDDARIGKFNNGELCRLLQQAEDMDMPTGVLKIVHDELDRLDGMQPTSTEYQSALHPILTILDLPWDKRTPLGYSLSETEARMDEKHYGLKSPKELIAEHLAVLQRNQEGQGKIIGLNGPPGVGKTSLAETIAYATGRKLVRVALGGVRDVTDIRGHRSTYTNAQPGRIVRALIQAKTKNPLILLDEGDKLGSEGGSTDTVAAALLEVLDPEQNRHFHDSFIDVPFDLSEVMFVVTTNDKRKLTEALRDRIEFIDLPSYSAAEKLQIAEKHLWPKEMNKAGLSKNDLMISPDALKLVISDYVREPGVRNLSRLLEKICRKSAYQIQKGKTSPIAVAPQNLADFLGDPLHRKPAMLRPDAVGEVNGLGVVGEVGSVMLFEVVSYKSKSGEFNITATGQLGETMKESIDVVKHWLKSHEKEVGLEEGKLDELHLHIDAPEHISKDGPSAGLAIATACLSAITGIPVRADVAMTGQISLKGRALRIGGTIAKIEGAMRDGMTKVLIPQSNVEDLAKLSDEIRKAIQIVHVRTMQDVVNEALHSAMRLAYDGVAERVVDSESTNSAGGNVYHQDPAPDRKRLPPPAPPPALAT